MTDELEFTGERFTPECVREIWYEHMHRYALAARLCAGRSVLDAACGEGYGAALLAQTARTVTGVDLAPEAIAHAERRYGATESLRFVSADCTRLPFEDGSFERVVSFETLEHLSEQSQMIAEFSRVMTDDGVLIVSSPDKAVYTDAQGADNPFHVRELYRDELEALLAEQFPAVRLLGQKLVFHSAIWSLDGVRSVGLQQWRDGKAATAETVGRAPMYYVALCARTPDALPELDADLWLFDDEDESVYEHYHGEIRRNMAAGGLLAERDLEIERLRRELDQKSERRSWFRRWFGRSP